MSFVGDVLITSEEQIAALLATIRQTESGGNYQAQARGASASGAYQYIDSTWANYGGYARAKDAPAEVQDRRAAEDVRRILRANGNRASAVFTSWYWPVALRNPSQLDIVPMPGAGNRRTVRSYVELQLGRLATNLSSGTRWPSPGDVIDFAGDYLTDQLPGVGIVTGAAGAAAGALSWTVDQIRPVVILGAVLTGAVALFVLGTRRAVAAGGNP